jgi:hypothetical protein
MAEMGGPGDVVQGLDPAEGVGQWGRAPGGRAPAEDRRDLVVRNRVRDHGPAERDLCRIRAGLCWLRRLDLGYPSSAERLGQQEARRLYRGPVACWGFRRERPPRERRLAEMSGPSRQAEGVGPGRHHRAFPAPDPARDCRGHDRVDRRRDRFRGENPPIGDRDYARCPA